MLRSLAAKTIMLRETVCLICLVHESFVQYPIEYKCKTSL